MRNFLPLAISGTFCEKEQQIYGSKKKKALSTALVQHTPKVCRQLKLVTGGFCFGGLVRVCVCVVLVGLDCFVVVVLRGFMFGLDFCCCCFFERSGEYTCTEPCT